MEKTPVLKALNIGKTFPNPYPVTLFTDVDLTVYPGEKVAIMGRSGEGKTTLLHILGTLESPTKGTLEIAGKQVHRACKTRLRNQHIGFVFQAFHLLEDDTVLDNVLMPARIARKPTHHSSFAYARACALLDKIDLSPRARFKAGLLSGGEKQRAAIARALCNDPDLLLADEPTGNLDSRTAAEVLELLFGFAEKEKKALVIVTHDLELAQRCDRIVELSQGKLQT